VLVVEKLKEILVGSLGIAGYVVWFIFSIIMTFLPLSYLNNPLWVDFIIIFVIISFPFIGGMMECGIWIWAFVEVLSKPISGWSIFYFVVFAIYFFTVLLPIALNIIGYIFALIAKIFSEE
jgi:hypothetical protein